MLVQLAKRLMDLQFLPHIVVINPHIKQVYDSYRQAFGMLTAFIGVALLSLLDDHMHTHPFPPRSTPPNHHPSPCVLHVSQLVDDHTPLLIVLAQGLVDDHTPLVVVLARRVRECSRLGCNICTHPPPPLSTPLLPSPPLSNQPNHQPSHCVSAGGRPYTTVGSAGARREGVLPLGCHKYTYTHPSPPLSTPPNHYPSPCMSQLVNDHTHLLGVLARGVSGGSLRPLAGRELTLNSLLLFPSHSAGTGGEGVLSAAAGHEGVLSAAARGERARPGPLPGQHAAVANQLQDHRRASHLPAASTTRIHWRYLLPAHHACSGPSSRPSSSQAVVQAAVKQWSKQQSSIARTSLAAPSCQQFPSSHSPPLFSRPPSPRSHQLSMQAAVEQCTDVSRRTFGFSPSYLPPCSSLSMQAVVEAAVNASSGGGSSQCKQWWRQQSMQAVVEAAVNASSGQGSSQCKQWSRQ
ncbi:unnamed protein product [Closterium sp. NIES-65]|nr:unnamed protein product [Closterium sp. NIES-65]